jgi:hypothetical protein
VQRVAHRVHETQPVGPRNEMSTPSAGLPARVVVPAIEPPFATTSVTFTGSFATTICADLPRSARRRTNASYSPGTTSNAKVPSVCVIAVASFARLRRGFGISVTAMPASGALLPSSMTLPETVRVSPTRHSMSSPASPVSANTYTGCAVASPSARAVIA